MKYKSVRLEVALPGEESKVVVAHIPCYKGEEWIKTLFVQLLGVRYDEKYCRYEIGGTNEGC